MAKITEDKEVDDGKSPSAQQKEEKEQDESGNQTSNAPLPRQRRGDAVHSPAPTSSSPLIDKTANVPESQDQYSNTSLWMDFFWRVLYLVLSLLYNFFFWLNLRISHGTARHTIPASKFRNKILVIGDGFAAGCGDNVTLGEAPGVARYLPRILAKESTLRQSWGVYNCGVVESTSLDWLPPAPTEMTRDKNSPPASLYTKVFDNPRFQDAAVVIIMLGNNEVIPPSESISNITRIAESLSSAGKIVFIQSCHTWPGKDAAWVASNVTRNRLLAEYLKTRDATDTIVAGVQIDGVTNYEYRLNSYFSHDDRHFSPKGYLKLAKDYEDLLVKPMVKVEFARFRKHLGF